MIRILKLVTGFVSSTAKKVEKLLFELIHKNTTEMTETLTSTVAALYGFLMILMPNNGSPLMSGISSYMNPDILGVFLLLSGVIGIWGLLGNGSRKTARRLSAFLIFLGLSFVSFIFVTTPSVGFGTTLPIAVFSLLSYIKLNSLIHK